MMEIWYLEVVDVDKKNFFLEWRFAQVTGCPGIRVFTIMLPLKLIYTTKAIEAVHWGSREISLLTKLRDIYTGSGGSHREFSATTSITNQPKHTWLRPTFIEGNNKNIIFLIKYIYTIYLIYK